MGEVGYCKVTGFYPVPTDVAGNKRYTANATRITPHDRSSISQRARKPIEGFFGWRTRFGDPAKTRLRGNGYVQPQLLMLRAVFKLAAQ